jgi:hypothetical protein
VNGLIPAGSRQLYCTDAPPWQGLRSSSDGLSYRLVCAVTGFTRLWRAPTTSNTRHVAARAKTIAADQSSTFAGGFELRPRSGNLDSTSTVRDSRGQLYCSWTRVSHRHSFHVVSYAPDAWKRLAAGAVGRLLVEFRLWSVASVFNRRHKHDLAATRRHVHCVCEALRLKTHTAPQNPVRPTAALPGGRVAIRSGQMGNCVTGTDRE